ncbi:MAG TPA: glycoside hydrolase family 3 N-terminal domain-containing protein [Candidatus Limnocylindrales bacterium]
MTRGPIWGAPGTAVLERVLLAFRGTEVSPEIANRLAAAPAAGVTLFQALNVRDPGQVRELTSALQRAASELLLIAADQENGQLQALGDAATPFAGNMAMGAADDVDLTQRVGRATGLEMRAMGVNVGYVPVCDVATNPDNPALGIRSFGDEPGRVGAHAAALVRGLTSAGVAATAKHFPGLGDLGVDSHHALASVRAGDGPERFDEVELVPFRSAIGAGARLVMSAHVGAPALTGDPGLPATLAPQVMDDLLRDRLGFDGLSVTDALDMAGITGGEGGLPDVVSAVRAGVDLLLTMDDDDARRRIERAILDAAAAGQIGSRAISATRARLDAVRSWIAAGTQPEIEVVGSPDHRELACELAERSITLIRNDAGLIPVRLAEEASIGVVQPEPIDLTPADTSSFVGPTLATAVAARHPRVTSYVTGHPPGRAEIAALRERANDHDLLIVGTISASLDPAQATLVGELEASGTPTITVALRTPWDISAYPATRTHACSYGILRPSMTALVDALWGLVPFRGHLPVALAGLYPRGHGLIA